MVWSMRKAQHGKKTSRRRIWARLGAISSTCVAAMLVFALSFGTVTTGVPAHDAGDTASSPQNVEQVLTSDDTAAVSDDTPANEAKPETTSYASLPEDEYAVNTVIVSIDGAQDIERIASQVDALDSTANVSVDTSDAEFGFVKLTYEGSASSGEVADLLYAQGVEAQPNFKYYALALDDEETDAAMAADADSSLTAQATHLNDPSSGEQWGLNIIRAYDA